MSGQELKRVHVIRQAVSHALLQKEAGEVLDVTTRQVRRLIQRVQTEGDAGFVHRGRGKPSNRRIPDKVKAKVLVSLSLWHDTAAHNELEPDRPWFHGRSQTECQRGSSGSLTCKTRTVARATKPAFRKAGHDRRLL
ncbi:MAG: helix-turn-helix domain-containing protein [Nitrospirota bacterium]